MPGFVVFDDLLQGLKICIYLLVYVHNSDMFSGNVFKMMFVIQLSYCVGNLWQHHKFAVV